MNERFSFDVRIDSVFYETYQAHGFSIAQSSIEYVLVLALMRIHDRSERSDIYSLHRLFEEILPSTEGINSLGEKTLLFEKARSQYKQLKGSHLLARTKTFRDKFIAHAGILSGNEQMPKYKHLGKFTDETITLVENLSISILDVSPGLDEIWKKYATSFFDTIIYGQENSEIELS
ncbi:MAG: hypothetical protein COB61_003315 [Thiotrichales bacterium]|nr:hypothetical protein [Thiotrichales bacterium]